MKPLFFFLSLLAILSPFSSTAQPWAVDGMDLNRAVPDGRVTEVWSGEGLPAAYSGNGVIVGVTDWGFDYTHPVFYDTLLSRYRILRAWDQFKNSGPAPAGFHYGTEYVGQNALLAAQCDTANIYGYNYHGNHVASIAAGAGAGTPYRGVAYDADLLLATFLVDEQAVIDAIHWMRAVSLSEGKRLVVNMSWGLYYIGNMDGTGRFSEVVDSLSREGVVFVTSGGNNGDVNFHISHGFATPDTILSRIQFAPGGGTPYWGQSVSMAGTPGDPFSFSLKVFDNQYNLLGETPFQATTDAAGYREDHLRILEDTIDYTVEWEAANPYNNRPQARLRVKKPLAGDYVFALAVAGEAGVFHAWNVAELTTGVGNWGGAFMAGQPGWIAGDPHYGVGAPGNIEAMITVASHKARLENPMVQYGGEISGYSSWGPTLDERPKPDLSAPGQSVNAALSSFTDSYQGSYSSTVQFDGRAYHFVSLSGTSMSSPFVAGVVALMLQANPYLTPTQVREILRETAREDEFTEEAGLLRAGNGKVDAEAAVKKALECIGILDFQPPKLQVSLYPNPAAESLYVTTSSSYNTLEMTIYDLSGRVLARHGTPHGVTMLDVSSYAPGCYVLKIRDGNEVVVKKWIKQ